MSVRSKISDTFRGLKNRKNWPIIGFCILILSIFLINTLHESYPDEFDNILGGWYILHGRLIYTGFFTHHGPVAYYLAALVEIFSGRSFVSFRFFYAIFLFLFTFGTFSYLRRSIKSTSLNFYYIFISLFAIGATYFWGHMILADNLSAIFLTAVYALIFVKAYKREFFTISDFFFISILSALALLSSLTFVYLVLTIYAFVGIYYLYSFEFSLPRAINRQTFKIAAIFLAPYLIFLIYLLATGSLSDYIYQAIIFNKKYYVYYPGSKGEVTANPLRFAIIIAQNFHNNFSSILIQARDFNFSFPFNPALAVVNATLTIYLIIKRKFGLALFVWLSLSFANGRSNPLTSSETDYQSAVYIMLSFFNLSFVLPTMYNDLNREMKYSEKLVLSFLFIILSIYSFFNFTYLLRKFSYKAYDKYMGFAGAIYDRPKIAPVINSIVDENSYAWIGPFHFEDLFFMKANIPSKYMILIPGIGSSEKIQQEMLADFNARKPDVIYFDKQYFILGRAPESYATFFLNFLSDNYVTLLNYSDGKIKYKSKIPQSDGVDFEAKLFLRKDKAPELIQKLLQSNVIEVK